MTSVFNNREVQLGLIILFVTYISFLFSGLDLNMKYSLRFLISLVVGLLICVLLNFRMITEAPHRGLLVLTHKEDTWFISTYKMMIFIIFFMLATILSGLIASGIHMDRSQDIFFLSMFVSSIYYLIISFWVLYNFTIMSAMGDNMDYKNDF